MFTSLCHIICRLSVLWKSFVWEKLWKSLGNVAVVCFKCVIFLHNVTGCVSSLAPCLFDGFTSYLAQIQCTTHEVTMCHAPATRSKGQRWRSHRLFVCKMLLTGAANIKSLTLLVYIIPACVPFTVKLSPDEYYNNFIDDKCTLNHSMARGHQATSHYQNQCWPNSAMPYIVIRGQKLNVQVVNLTTFHFSVS